MQIMGGINHVRLEWLNLVLVKIAINAQEPNGRYASSRALAMKNHVL